MGMKDGLNKGHTYMTSAKIRIFKIPLPLSVLMSYKYDSLFSCHTMAITIIGITIIVNDLFATNTTQCSDMISSDMIESGNHDSVSVKRNRLHKTSLEKWVDSSHKINYFSVV